MGSDQLRKEVIGAYDKALEDASAKRFAELREEVTVFPRAAELLRALHERGITVVLATSGRPDDVETIRERLGADEPHHRHGRHGLGHRRRGAPVAMR